MSRAQFRLALAIAVAWLGLSPALRLAEEPEPASFEKHILPILRAKCLACHSGAAPQGKLSLATVASIVAGGASGRAIVAGSSEKSLLVAKVVSGAMPPAGEKLAATEIALLRSWIDRRATEAGAQASHSEPVISGVTENDVAPVFQMHCIVCHGKRRQEGGLDLRTQASRLKGGRSGPALVRGKPEQSLLMKRIVAGEMPPPKLLFDYVVRPPASAQVDLLRQWIATGAPESLPASPAAQAKSSLGTRDEEQKFWSIQPPRRPAVPVVRQANLVHTPVDAFLLQKLNSKGLSFSPATDRVTLLRRAYLDLIGLPPTTAELESFLRDERPDAYEQLVDRLLQSPQYGERWGQFWLNAAGYSDSEGIIDADHRRPHAWRYRDYVIRSFNADKPYDRFLTEQLAGDELVDYRHSKAASPAVIDQLAATGFLRMAPDGTYSPANSSIQERMNVIADEIEILGSAVMGLTLGCARCHDHKYDPIPQRDYYRLAAILQAAYDPYDWLIPAADNPSKLKFSSRHLDVALASERQEVSLFNSPIEADVKRLEAAQEAAARPLREKALEERFATLPAALRAELKSIAALPADRHNSLQNYLAAQFQDTLKVTNEELARRFPAFKAELDKSQKLIDEQKKRLKPKPLIRALFDMGGEPSPTYLLRRGDAQTPGESVEPGVPSVIRAGLTPYTIVPPAANRESSGRRLALARWLVQPNHPLTTRVIVNRIWMHHFGRGLVASPANFGRTGVAPTHPELLDWLATEFVRAGWSVKHLHRLLMTSNAYRQSSLFDQAIQEADPDNLRLSRMPMRRLEAEVLYDSILKVTGSLDTRQFGPPEEVDARPDGEVVPKPSKEGWRRSIYVLQRRRTPLTALEVFDLPPMSPNCIERRQSTVPTQALQMMNSDGIQERARYFAGRLIDEFGDDKKKLLQSLYLRTLSRPPSEKELGLAVSEIDTLEQRWAAHLEKERNEAPIRSTAQWRALADFCHAMLSSAEFLYVD